MEAMEERDYWIFPNEGVIIGYHVSPRTSVYVADEDNCPVPLEYLDIFRRTITDISFPSLREIQDFWTTDKREEPGREFDEEWIGETRFM